MGMILLLTARPLVGELVVLSDGGILKARSVQVREESVTVELKEGGRLHLSILAVERIVEDEVEEVPERVLPVQPFSNPSLRFASGQRVGEEVPFASLIERAAERFGVNPALLVSIIAVESSFQPRAVSPKGARGLMQLMPATAARFGVRLDELFDPERNVEAGTRYVRFLLDRFGEDLEKVLASYNAGEGAVDRWGGVPPYRETRGYVVRVSEEFRSRSASVGDRSSTTSVQSSSF
jgi:hypothetical protein